MSESGSDSRRRALSVLREPLLHFAGLGALVFGLHALVAPPPDARAEPQVIELSEGFLAGLATQHERRTGEQPTEGELQALADAFVREEALYREALSLGLDQGDVIVRRRLVQKMEFLLRGAIAIPDPTDEELRAYLDEHAERYHRPPRIALTHIFFSRDRRGDDAERAAREALDRLPPDASGDDLGDPFLLGRELPLRSERELASTFGPGFARAVTSMPGDGWGGPVESSYGWHLVRVNTREAGTMPALREVRDRLARQWAEERREEGLSEAVSAVVGRYSVTRSPSP